MSYYRCPKCSSLNVATERRPDGDSVCGKCGYKAATGRFLHDHRLTPKAPSPWPPRVWVWIEPTKNGNGGFTVRETQIAKRPGWPGAEATHLSLEEHTHLLAEAVRIAKAQVYSEVALMADNLSHDDYINGRLIDQLNRKASELRKEKGATLTPENGGKE